MPDDAPAGSAKFVPNENMLGDLMNMGFGRNACARAV